MAKSECVDLLKMVSGRWVELSCTCASEVPVRPQAGGGGGE